MDYRSGRMGIAEGLALAFIVSFPPIFLSTPAKSVEAGGSMGWAPGLIGAIIGCILVYLYTLVLKRYPGDLIQVWEKLLGRNGAWLAGGYYFAVFFGIAVLWIRQFAENTLLTALPYASFDHILLWYGLGSAALVYAGIEALCRSAYIIMPFAIISLTLVLVLLFPMIKPLYLLPWQGNGLTKLIRPTLNLIGASIPLCLLLIMAPAFQTVKTVQRALVFGYGISTIMRIASVIVFIMVFGALAGAEKMLPFYEMARLIYINRYIQRLESFFIVLWVIIGVLAIAICLYGSLYILARLCKLPTIRPLIPAMALIMIQLAAIPPDTNGVLVLEAELFGKFCAPGAVLLPVILLLAAWIKGRKKHGQIKS